MWNACPVKLLDLGSSKSSTTLHMSSDVKTVRLIICEPANSLKAMSGIPSVIVDFIGPGYMQFGLIDVFCNFFAKDFVNPYTACLLAPYIEKSVTACADKLAILIIGVC